MKVRPWPWAPPEAIRVKLVVGLGNVGRKYEQTRHNVGFQVLGELARRHGTSRPKGQFQGETVEATVGGQRTLLLAPHTLMNRSGSSVRAACDFYKVPLEDLLVVADDFNLDRGRIRLRAQGSAGGQKGLADIIRALGSDAWARLRVGIGAPPPAWDPADFVLGRMTGDELREMEFSCQRAADAVEVWAREGIQVAMNRYNAAATAEE